MKKRPMFFVLLLSFLFISCENLLSPKDSYNNGDEKTYTITGDINIEGALPNELFNENSTNSVARTGFPTVPNISDSDLNLSISATNDSGSTIEGTINAEKTQYSIKLQKGQWTITISGKKSDVVILEGSVTVVLNDEYPVQKAEKIVLKPKNTGGKGNLSLKLALDDESIICGGVKATLSSSEEEPETKYILFTDREGYPASEINLEFSDISSGTYSFNLEFYKSMITIGPDNYECENIIYILNDTVNIFDGLTTNEWSGTGYSEDTFTLTQEMITSFAMTTFYVDAVSGNDDNEGTFFAPKMSINKVLEKIDTVNDGTSEYRIYIKGNINNTSENSSFENDSFINITPTNTLYLLICGFGNEKSEINAERNSSQTGRVMYIGENANVTLQNLILKGGHLTKDENEEANGAGLYILNNNANVKIENSEIRENKIDNGSGAGLRVKHQADKRLNLTIKNSKISSNTIYHNNAVGGYSGAGIAIENVGANIKITDSEISDNVINQEGVDADITEDKGVGLWLGSCATTTISGTDIKQNKIENAASTNGNAGGGVYLKGGSLTIQNSTKKNTDISDNTSGYGDGVYVEDGTFTMNGGAVISSNNDVYLADGTTITVTENLTSTDTVATITPENYELGIQVLKAESGVTLKKYPGNFAVTTRVLSDEPENWFIDSAGYLVGGSVTAPEQSENGEYEVSSLKNLLWIALELKKGNITSLNMKLTDDIDIPSGKWKFSQLNAPNHSTIDGQGHSITINENVSKFGNSAGGLFYKCNLSTVKNLVLKGSITANTSGDEGYIGALCRSAWRTTIQNVMSTVKIIDNGSGNAGGLVGYFGGNNRVDDGEYTPDSFIKNCAVYANISSENGTAGGLVGESWANTQTWKIENCIYKGTVSSREYAGALIGNENTGKTSYLTNIWYCEPNNREIFGKIGNEGEEIEVSGVERKDSTDIATPAAANLLNTDLDETDNYVWKYDSDSAYPTLKALSSE